MQMRTGIEPRPLRPQIRFSNQWHLLGPFRLGTREAVWGANPLDALGGFHCLPVNEDAIFHSSLAVNGIVRWSVLDTVQTNQSRRRLDEGEIENRALVQLEATFSNVDWVFQQSVYGWAALQYQGFARGFINLSGSTSCRVALNTDHVLELHVNNKPYFGGDFYAFNRAPLILVLGPGDNKVDLRLIRDVRSMGGVGVPSIPVQLSTRICTTSLNAMIELALVPDIVDRRLTSPYISVPVQNECGKWLSVTGVRSHCAESPTTITPTTSDAENEFCDIELLNESPIRLAPGQIRPLSLWVRSACVDIGKSIDLNLMYHSDDQHEEGVASVKLTFRTRLIRDPQKFTFLHPSGTVSYAILRPPETDLSLPRLPPLLNLHGAGLEADSPQVRHMLDSVPNLNAWLLFPAGMSPWSGDDWHTWGLADVEAAVAAIPAWIDNMKWVGPGVDTTSWIVTGHSNGGQGAWYLSTHRPDQVFATAIVSGYSSIQNYVPFTMWRESSPLAESVVQNALTSYRHELLLSNLSSMSIYQQHGARDDNVPPYHSRLMNSLLNEHGCTVEYVELPKRAHWFDGAMATPPLRAFYTSVLDGEPLRKEMPKEFEFIVPNSGDIGSRGGISIDQLESPDSLGKVYFHRDVESRIWYLETLNAHRVAICFRESCDSPPLTLFIDGNSFPVPDQLDAASMMAFVKRYDKWEACDDRDWRVLSTRYGRQRGSLDTILRTRSAFQILTGSEQCLEAALQVSRNLMQYYGADTNIATVGQNPSRSDTGNVITVITGKAVPAALIDHFPVEIRADGIHLRKRDTGVPKHIPNHAGLGAALLRPRPDEAVELVLWGWDDAGLQQAVRMVPTLSGAGQPDFIVLGKQARLKGHAGVLAMGFFSYAWQISAASYVP